MVAKFLWAITYLTIMSLFKSWKYILGVIVFIFILWFITVGGIIVLQVIGGL